MLSSECGFNPHYSQYYTNQCGHGLPVFRGSRYQRGHGIGNLLAGAFRSVLPKLIPAAKSVGKTVLKQGMEVASDVLNGRSLKESAKHRARRGGMELLDTVMGGMKKAIKRQPSPDFGRVVKAKKASRRIKRDKREVLQRKRKRREVDIFD